VSPVLEAIGVTKHYGTLSALDGLSFAIPPGEVFCLLGANGAGKTTLINCFLGFVTPTDGSVRVGGLDVSRHALETKRLIGYVPEQVMLYRELSGLENLRFFSRLAGGRERADEDLLRLLERVRLSRSDACRRLATYSKGMRQRVGLAIALAKEAAALLLDEPASGLDPKAASEFSHLVKELSGEGVAVLMTTHDLFRARRTGSRVGIMRQGRLIRTLDRDELDRTDLEAVYLDAMQD